MMSCMPCNVDDDCILYMHLVNCSPDQNFCWEEFTGNTMTQYSPNGQLMFLHTNLSPKWNLMVPGDFEAYTRRCCPSAAKILPEPSYYAKHCFYLNG